MAFALAWLGIMILPGALEREKGVSVVVARCCTREVAKVGE